MTTVTAKQSAVRRPKMAERAQQLRALMFPEWELMIWDRKTNDGFITIPRILPIVMQAIDEQGKGLAAGHTYFGLWARSPDHALVTIDNQATFAAEAGFKGARAVDTWRRRMKQLRELGFIRTHDGPTGEFHFVLLVNPILSAERLFRRKAMQKELYVRLTMRLAEIGAAADQKKAGEYLDQAREHVDGVAAGTIDKPLQPIAVFLNEGTS